MELGQEAGVDLGGDGRHERRLHRQRRLGVARPHLRLRRLRNASLTAPVLKAEREADLCAQAMAEGEEEGPSGRQEKALHRRHLQQHFSSRKASLPLF